MPIHKALLLTMTLLATSTTNMLANTGPLEVELKLQLSEQNLQKLQHFLASNKQVRSKGKEETIQHYLDHPRNSFLFRHPNGFIDAKEQLRVRISSKYDSMCTKQEVSDTKSSQVIARKELETKVGNGKTALELFKALGYTVIASITKTRGKYRYKEFEIALDEIQELGSFVEVELKEQVDDAKLGLQKIYRFLKDLGITECTHFEKSYFHLILNQKHQPMLGKKISLES